jgi:hypothetical protein
MKLIEFAEQTHVIAKHQPQYLAMPAYIPERQDEATVCCWQLSPEEIEIVKKTGLIWHSVLRCGEHMQPQLLSVEKPEMPVSQLSA